MNVSYLVTYGNLVFFAIAAGLYFLGSYQGAKKAKQETYRQAYQNDLNNKVEEFLYDQKKKDSD